MLCVSAGSEYNNAKERRRKHEPDVFEDLIIPLAVTTAFCLLLVAIIVTSVVLVRKPLELVYKVVGLECVKLEMWAPLWTMLGAQLKYARYASMPLKN